MKHELYNLLPIYFKNITASIYGRKLYKRRYGNKYFSNYLTEVIERQSWEPDKLERYQNDCIKTIVNISARQVPYYRDLLAKLNLKPEDIKNKEEIIKLPLLEKTVIKSKPELFLNDRLDVNKLNKMYTSGTTGAPLCVYRDKKADAMAYAYYEARWRLPYGITKDSSWAMLGGKLVIPINQVKPPFWIWNSGLKQLYMSSYHLSMDFAGSYLKELKKRRLDYVHGYASSLYSLALFAEKLGFDDIGFKVAISNAEPLYSYQREKIEKIFHCRIVDTYGCTEWCFQAFECSERKLHISPDVGLFELVDSKGIPVNDGEIGEVVCTGFTNYAQPLIRYRTGDSAKISKRNCKCESTFPVLESIEGRNDDLIILRDGRRIGRLDPLFKGDLPVLEAQIIQEETDKFTIKVVPGDGWGQESEELLLKSFYDYLGSVKVFIEKVDQIPRTKSGKFRAVVSNIKEQTN